MSINMDALPAIMAGVSTGLDAFSGINAAKWDYPSCGKRPLFIGKRRNEYDECIKTAPRAQNGGAGAGMIGPKTESNEDKKDLTPYLIGGGILLLGGIILIATKKK